MAKVNSKKRYKARRYGAQALYQWQLSRVDMSDIEEQFFADNDMDQVDVPYFKEILHTVPKELEAIDEVLSPLLDREIDEVTPVELALLRMGVFELLHRLDVPYKVVLNESIELAKTFGATDSHKYINGVLGKAAEKIRHIEHDAESNNEAG